MTRLKLHAVFFALAAFVPWWTSNARAACTGSSPTWTSTPDQVSLSTCIKNAVSGDTINVVAGSATWSVDLIAPDNKNVTIVGAGSSATHIKGAGTCQAGSQVFDLGFTSTRVTGIDFNEILVVFRGQDFRFDNNTLRSAAGLCDMWFKAQAGTNGTLHPRGVVDHNTFTNVRTSVVTNGDCCGAGMTDHGYAQWNQATNLGSQQAVFIEANTFNYTAACPCSNGDAHYGGRLVYRFNTVTGKTGGGQSYIEFHGVDGDFDRAGRSYEIYQNTITNDTAGGTLAFQRVMLLRGATGVVWGNTATSSPSTGVNTYIALDIPRRLQNEPRWGFCDGTHTLWQPDGNQLPNGWRCRDQPGTGQDTSLSTDANMAPQLQEPIYLWSNTFNAVSLGTSTDCNVNAVNVVCPDNGNNMPNYIQSNRDYYNQVPSFTGASGVGAGTLASRPATCTTGVGYWATDQGNWNQSGSGGQGVLYKCTAPNTWSLYYTPFTYPHPLQKSGGGGPNPPTNLRVVLVN